MSAPTIDYVYRCDVLEVHDGDTYKLRVDLGFGTAKTEWIRLRGVNTPELKTGGAGLDARAFAELILMGGESRPAVTVRTEKTKAGSDVRSFVRYVADVWVDGTLFADTLIAAGHAAAHKP